MLVTLGFNVHSMMISFVYLFFSASFSVLLSLELLKLASLNVS